MSEWRACTLVGADCATVRYQSARPAETALRERLRVLAGERRRFGYRRLHVLLRREGLVQNRKKTERHNSRGRSLGASPPRPQARHRHPFAPRAARPAEHALVDRLRPRLARLGSALPDPERGRRRHEGVLGSSGRHSISGRRVARELTALVARRGQPTVIVSDHGTEFTANAMLAWTAEAKVGWHFIAPGKPMQNGVCEGDPRADAR